MKTIESTHPLCGLCGRPIAFLILGGEIITADGSAVTQGTTIVLQRHSCQAPKAKPESTSGPEATDLPRRRHGALPKTLTQAMECARGYLATGPKALRTTLSHMMSFGFKESTSRHALSRLGVIRKEVDGFLTVTLPDVQNERI